jgi:hypothetical protein
MRSHPFLLASVLALAFACQSQAAEKPRPAQASQSKKVWTNEDMDQLRVQGGITIFNEGPETPTQAPTSTQIPTAPPEPATLLPKTGDPAWYADQAYILQAELDKRQAALRDAQARIAQAAKGITEPGIEMNKGNAGVTPEAGLANLEARVREAQNQLDELSDLARQNDIPPGDLRT